MYCGCIGVVLAVAFGFGIGVVLPVVVLGLSVLGVSDALAGVNLLSVLAVFGVVVAGAAGGSTVLGVTVLIGMVETGVLCLPMPRFAKKLRIGPA